MNDEELARQLRGRLDEELGDVRGRAGSRERLRQGLRKRRRTPWFRASIVVPVAAAAVIAAMLLSIPALLNRPREEVVVPAGVPAVSVTADPSVTADSVPTTEPAPAQDTPASTIPVTENPEGTPDVTVTPDDLPARDRTQATTDSSLRREASETSSPIATPGSR